MRSYSSSLWIDSLNPDAAKNTNLLAKINVPKTRTNVSVQVRTKQREFMLVNSEGADSTVMVNSKCVDSAPVVNSE